MGALLSCARTETETSTDALLKYLDAWVGTNYPDAKLLKEYGTWVLEDIPGTGKEVKADSEQYVFISYIRKDMQGNVAATNIEDLARQIGTYNSSVLYGYSVWSMSYSIRGILDAMDGMKVGGTRTFLVPAWLMTYETKEDYSDYYTSTTETTSTVFTVTVNDIADDIKKWQGSQLDAWSKENLGGVDSTAYTSDEDALRFGFYWKSVKGPVIPDGKSAEEFTMPSDTTVYINYTGRFLNGKVFDTTDERVAKDAGIYSSSKTYAPQQIKWSSEPANLYMGSSVDKSSGNLKPGFYYALFKMRPYEKIITAFWSELGYGASGSSPTIPGYCPLVFEIEMVDSSN